MRDAAAGVEACVVELVGCRLLPRKLDETGLLAHATSERRGYELQREVAVRLTQEGLGPVVGYKLGMTSAALQAQFGIAEPLFGPIHSGCLVLQDERLDCSDMRRIGLECEVAVTLGRDLPQRRSPHEAGGLASAIATFHAGIEIVEDRFTDIQSASPWAIVADGVLHRACALGRGTARAPEADAEGGLWLGETRLGTGRVSNLWGGGPLTAVAWLANKLNAQGTMLRAGDIVFCGSVAPVVWLSGSGTAGTVRASFPQLGDALLWLS